MGNKLTVFTPTYNRKHTIARTYESLYCQSSNDFNWLIIDDGSSDGTREWVGSLGEKIVSSGSRFDWMGRLIDGEDGNHFIVQTKKFAIEYVYIWGYKGNTLFIELGRSICQ